MIFPGDGSHPGGLANRGQYIEFYHLISDSVVRFRGFLTKFEDEFASEWNEEYAFGRMDPISTFKRTGRKINIGWKVVAETAESAKANLANVGALMQMLYPAYNNRVGTTAMSTTHMSGPPLLRMKFMNLAQNSVLSSAEGQGSAKFSGLLGYVNGFTNSPVLDDGLIEDDGGSAIYPKTMELGCTFTVLHTHELGWQGGQFRGQATYPYGQTTAAGGWLEQVAGGLADAGANLYDRLIGAGEAAAAALPEGAATDEQIMAANNEVLMAEGSGADSLPAENASVGEPPPGGGGGGIALMDD